MLGFGEPTPSLLRREQGTAMTSWGLLSGGRSGGRWLKSQRTCLPCRAAGIVWVPDTVQHRHFSKIERAHAFQAGDIDAVLRLVRAALVVRVNTATRTEKMLPNARVEAVACQHILALDEAYAVKPGRYGDGTAHPAIGARASAGSVKAVTQSHGELHGTTMALRPMLTRCLCHFLFSTLTTEKLSCTHFLDQGA